MQVWGQTGDMRVIGGGTNGAGTGGAVTVVFANEFLFFPFFSFLAFSIFPVAPPIIEHTSYSDSLQEFLQLCVPGYFQTCASSPVSSKS